jgi:hypothetical protein
MITAGKGRKNGPIGGDAGNGGKVARKRAIIYLVDNELANMVPIAANGPQ